MMTPLLILCGTIDEVSVNVGLICGWGDVSIMECTTYYIFLVGQCAAPTESDLQDLDYTLFLGFGIGEWGLGNPILDSTVTLHS